MDQNEKPGLQVWTGRHVTLELVLESGDREQLEADIVADAAADFDQGFLGESTPLAKAIIGKSVGSDIPYVVGDIVRVRILAISPNLRSQPKDLTERREETVRKAVADSDRTNTLIYASSMSNKWGDMDPKIFEEEEQGDQGKPDPRTEQENEP